MAGESGEVVGAEEYVDRVILDGRFLEECGEQPEAVAGKLGLVLAPGAVDRIREEGVGNLMRRPPPYGIIARLGSWITYADGWQGPARGAGPGGDSPGGDSPGGD